VARWIGAILIGLAGLTMVLVGRQGQLTSTERTLVELQQILAKAWVAGDRAMIERIIAPEWTSTGPNGTITTRAQVLADIFERRVHRIEQLEIDDVRVRVFGDAAVVTGRTHGVGSVSGTDYDVRIRFTDVFVRLGREWRAVTSHASLLSRER
jgi:uncharacterized protein DUF4440